MLIPKNVIHIAKAACSDKARYQLCNVHLSRRGGKPLATVTDGKILMRATWDEPDQEEFPDVGGDLVTRTLDEEEHILVPPGMLIDAQKSISKCCIRPILEYVHVAEQNDPIIVTTTDLDRTKVLKERPWRDESGAPPYPDVDCAIDGLREAWATPNAGLKAIFHPAIMKLAADTMLKVFPGEHNFGMKFSAANNQCPVELSYSSDGVTLHIYMMPLVRK